MGDFGVDVEEQETEAQENEDEMEYTEFDDEQERALAFLNTHGETTLITTLVGLQIVRGETPEKALTDLEDMREKGFILYKRKEVQVVEITPAGKQYIREQW